MGYFVFKDWLRSLVAATTNYKVNPRDMVIFIQVDSVMMQAETRIKVGHVKYRISLSISLHIVDTILVLHLQNTTYT